MMTSEIHAIFYLQVKPLKLAASKLKQVSGRPCQGLVVVDLVVQKMLNAIVPRF